MRGLVTLFIVLTALVCSAVLAVSVYPGVLNDLLLSGFLLGVLAAPIVICLGLVLVWVAARKGWFTGQRIPWRRVAVIPVLLLSTYVALKLYLPRRLAWTWARPSFEELVPTATPEGAAVDQRVGLYRVDQVVQDDRGGVYFRVYAGSDGFGPDTLSYGFVFRPNRGGTPFGAARYSLHPLGEDWSWFRVSDDWF